jgi:phage-related protein
MDQANRDVQGGLGKITGALKGLIGPVAAAVGIGQTFSAYLNEADALGDFAEKVNESVQDIDAWGQAVVLAGGDAVSFQSTVQTMTKSLAEIKNLGSGRAKAALDAFGISATDAEGNVRKATDVLMELAGKAETMSKEEFVGLAQKMGVDAGTANLLSQGGAAAGELIAKMREYSYTGQDADAAGKFNDALMLLKKSYMMVASVILREVLPPLTFLAEKITKFVKYLSGHRESVLAFFAGLALVITAKLIPAFLAMAKSILANPLTWLIALLAGVAIMIEDMLVWVDGGESAFGDLWTALLGSPEEARAIWAMFKEDLGNLITEAGYLWGALKEGCALFVEGAKFLWADLTGFISGAFEGISGVVSAVVSAIVGFFTGLWDAVSGGASSVAEAIGGFFRAAFEAIAGFVETFIIAPIRKVMELAAKAKALITGEAGAEAIYGQSEADMAKSADELNAQNMARWRESQAAQAQASPGAAGPSSAMVSPPAAGDTTVNNDNTSNATFNVTQNITTSDPAAAGAAANAGLGDVAQRTARSQNG